MKRHIYLNNLFISASSNKKTTSRWAFFCLASPLILYNTVASLHNGITLNFTILMAEVPLKIPSSERQFLGKEFFILQ